MALTDGRDVGDELRKRRDGGHQYGADPQPPEPGALGNRVAVRGEPHAGHRDGRTADEEEQPGGQGFSPRTTERNEPAVAVR